MNGMNIEVIISRISVYTKIKSDRGRGVDILPTFITHYYWGKHEMLKNLCNLPLNESEIIIAHEAVENVCGSTQATSRIDIA